MSTTQARITWDNENLKHHKGNFNHFVAEVIDNDSNTTEPICRRYFGGTQAAAITHFKANRTLQRYRRIGYSILIKPDFIAMWSENND